ncbi:YceD family protein [Desulfobulbus oligotrophicus]|jgi:uncharacterized protein|uniref:DUF177 domain-containing protein n=1 Tax=Desulfobulbus oligotrophicus TaxID=1909699 RepID=A0A7T5VEW5_9BACT|nr:DUF177 domain-containing protein [Desulfobulbus oligotrophicus]QQG66536.1 DUF177 domain-containing protein [Desulfobulbus oligotrophicus]
MLVRLSEIPPGGSHIEMRSVKGFDGMSEVVAMPESLHVTGMLKRKGENKAELQGRLAVILQLDCDRCLALYELKVDTALQLLFEYETDASWRLRDLEGKITAVDTIILDEPVIDLNEAVRQQLFLMVPMKKLCSEECKGICAWCGGNRNQVLCKCDREHSKSPFAILTHIKK